MSLIKNIIIDHNFIYRFNPDHYTKFVNKCRVKTVFL